MHLFFDTELKLHIGEIPEKPDPKNYVWPPNYQTDLKEYDEAIAVIKHNALTVGNPELIEKIIPLPIGMSYKKGHFYPFNGGYETLKTLHCDEYHQHTKNSCFTTVAILTLPEEKKNTMENMINVEEILSINKRLKEINDLNLSDIQFLEKGKAIEIDRQAIEDFKFTGLNNVDFVKFSIYKDHSTTASSSVAAPKEEKDFEALKWKVGTIMAEQFLKFNDGKFTAAIELNPATHALTEYLQSELASLRQQLKEREEVLKELLPMAEWKLQSTSDYLANFSETIETEPEKYKECDRLKAIIERARKLLNP